MSDKPVALQMADELDSLCDPYDSAIATELRRLHAALAEPEQEPVAVHQYRTPHCPYWYDGFPDHEDGHGPYEVRTLFTAPAPRKPLTDEEVVALWRTACIKPALTSELVRSFARAIERAHGIGEQP